jgi:tRNA-dihydrouridine synthase
MDVAERLQDIGIQALTIHARTRAQMYKGEADWTWIEKVKNNPRIHIPIFGNGDIDSPEKALIYKNKFGVDGMMIGRAAIGYPWIFNEIKHLLTPTIFNLFEIKCVEDTFCEYLGPEKMPLDYKFTILEDNKYFVDQLLFPRVKKQDLNPAISKFSYNIDISSFEDFKLK